MNVLVFYYGTVLNSRVCVCVCAPYMLYSRRACGRRFPWWCLRRLWELPWVWPRPHRWLESVFPTWLSGRFWAPSPGRNYSVWVECCSALWDLQSFLLEFDFSCFLLFFLLSETKIPLWRWQRMMIFMLANTICCIVTSVLLNMVDHRQVKQSRSALPCTRSRLGVLTSFFLRRAESWTGPGKDQSRCRETQTESHSERERRSRSLRKMKGLGLVLLTTKFYSSTLTFFYFVKCSLVKMIFYIVWSVN